MGLIEDLTDLVTPQEIKIAVGEMMIKNQMFGSIENHGPAFIPADASPISKQFSKLLDSLSINIQSGDPLLFHNIGALIHFKSKSYACQ